MCSPVCEVLEVPPAPLQHVLRPHAAAAELLLLHPVLHTAPGEEKYLQLYKNISIWEYCYLGVPMSSTVTGSSSPVTSSPANCWKSLTNQR